ncbi:iron-containing alcohol dehydrogenase [Shigella flexneri]
MLTLMKMVQGPKSRNYDVRANVMWGATQALNGLIGDGVPQDWATHMLGHELTAMHGLDHARTLAIVLPALWNENARPSALSCCNMLNASGTSLKVPMMASDAAIAATRNFFEQFGVPTHLSDYGLTAAPSRLC